jgi:DNA polymerase-3 subunit epsilon
MKTSLAELKVLTLDCQATGANPDKGHLLEIGWIPTRAASADNPMLTGLQAYLVRLPTDATIPRAVERITGISTDFSAAGISPKNAWERLIATAQQVTAGSPSVACPTIIHFARFEQPFLHQLHQKYSPECPFPFRIICTHEIAIRLLPDLPRKGIRAIAGYYGHSTPEFKRSAGHVIATAFVWKKMVKLLDTTCGISSIDQLIDWLVATKPPGRSRRSYPMNPAIRNRLPDTPGVYRMLRTEKGDPLYIGKAKSLNLRVKTYFRQKTPHTERTLEMLSQARELNITQTGSALEAAILESDEIKRYSPPYNIALRRRQRELVFFTKDLCRHSVEVDRQHPVGPLPAGRFIKMVSAFGSWVADGMKVNDDDYLNSVRALLNFPAEYAPQIDCMRQGFSIFRQNYGSRLTQQSALGFMTALGAMLWREQMNSAALADVGAENETDNGDVESKQKNSIKEHVWTPEEVVHAIEKMIRRSAYLIRRARWLCLLSESSLTWSTADNRDHCKRLMVFENGSVVEQGMLEVGKKPPIPPGCGHSFRTRQMSINLITYDRLRVLTTELRRLVSERRHIELRLSPKVTLTRQEVMRALRWV